MNSQDQEFGLGSSWLPGNETGTPEEQLRWGLQSVLFDGCGNHLAAADWQLGDFSNQLTQGVPNYSSAYQSHNPIPHPLAGADWQLGDNSNQLTQGAPNYNRAHQSYNPVPQVGHVVYDPAIIIGNIINPYCQPSHTNYTQAISNGSTSRSANLIANPSAEITATRECQNMTLGTNAGVPSNATVLIEYDPAISIGNTINPYCQPRHTNYTQTISNGSTSRSVNLITNPSAEITAIRGYQNMTLGTNAGVPSNAAVPNRLSMPSEQSFVDNWGQPVSVSSLLDILTQPLGSTIFSNDNYATKMEMRFVPADDKQERNSNVSTGTDVFQVLDEHGNNLNRPTGMDYQTCNAGLAAKTPVTPDKTKKPEKLQLTMRTENTNEQNNLKSKEYEAIQHTCDVKQNIVDSSTAASTIPREAINLEKVGDHGIDLNRTPQQKLPKRRKHRPKVVIEGKPKRTTGATTKKSASSKDKSPGKRKYVRRHQETDTRKKPADSNDGRVRRSCKRTLDLDFDLDLDKSKDENPENIVHQPEMQQSNRYFDLNSISENTGLCSGFDGIGKMESISMINQENGSEKVNEKESAHISCSEHMWNENTFLQNRQWDTGNDDQCQNSCSYRYTLKQQPDHPGTGRTEVTTLEGLERSRNIMSHTTPNEEIQSLMKPSEARNLGSGYNHAVEQTYYKTMCQEVLLQEAEGRRNSCSASAASEKNQKKRKTENRVQVDTPAPQSGLSVLKDDRSHNGIKRACCSTSQTTRSILESNPGSIYPQRTNNGISSYSDKESPCSQVPIGIRSPRQHNASPPQSYTERGAEPKKLAQANSSIPQTEVNKCKLIPATPAKTGRSVKKRNSKSMTKHTAKGKAAPATFTSNVLDANGALQKQKSSSGYPCSLEKTRGEAEIHVSPYIDEVIKLFNSLDIRVTSDQDKKALITYGGGGDGTIIPFQAKRKRPRPKVDLDNETTRVWNLLMQIEGSTDRDRMYKGSESWWENERKVFRGRADSFIARMRLVQGDRHFSMWKGSVVDSVIGVFLTQNVSDHLSSSAFMTLAAQFPLELRSGSTAGPQDRAGILVKEPETCVPDPGEPVSHEKVSRTIAETSGAESQSFQEEIISSQDSFDLSVIIQGTEAIRSYSGSNSETEDPTPGSAHQRINELTSTDMLSSWKATPLQDTYNCITEGSLSDQRSSHEHTNSVNFEHEQHTAFIHIGNSDNLLKRSPDMHSENYQLHTTGNRVLQEGFDEESSSSWPSTISGLSQAKYVACTSRRIEQTGSLNRCTVQNQSPTTSKENPPRSHKALTENQYVYQQSTSPPKYKTADSQQSDINSQTESTTGIRQINLTEVVDRGNSTIQQSHNVPKTIEDNSEAEESHLPAEKQRKLENSVDASNTNDRFRPSATTSNGNNSTTKRKKGKAGGDIKPDEFWESLRKQVQANSAKKERNYDTMDSMDYEAIRHASVKYISGIIRERGMNNMLAERIKEFLNRLVRVHGSIDLEWLRDVPPDEAKNYLLNIWGIGLKSVECVRLLTLHHLAFPVDTNVGRIAVRLGWVPLQPLPESLQLHLLQLYPILETVQKYLWPRLCNLDQQTLYELHYHLITFGKVFCTKDKPNCNACPMRGECRHFASAFASARLALPEPEQRSIVSSCLPIASDSNPSLVINTALQLPADNVSFTGTCSGKSKCEPIIEEPETPELESTEVFEYDIEDTFWEDSDEVPTVRLNMHEFTANLRDYVQANNMELQASDLSKALVALTPEEASVPAPKLKNVNRLRTEHRVYELPDLHPLLRGMDRRELDDPSPYLLAIWTPGETANTVQPPESTCSSRETGQLCNEKTCFTCNTVRESESHTVRGTLLIPCRTAMRGRFPLNGTYFQVNEVFADDKSSKNPIDVPREWLWNLPIRTVYFGTSVTSIFRGLSTEQIQMNFWRGFVCVRGFDRETRAPRPLVTRLHCSQSRLTQMKNAKAKEESNNNGSQKKGSSRSSSNKIK